VRRKVSALSGRRPAPGTALLPLVPPAPAAPEHRQHSGARAL